MRVLCERAISLSKGESFRVLGSAGSLDAAIAALVSQRTNRRVVFVARDKETCIRVTDDIRLFLDPSSVKMFTGRRSNAGGASLEARTDDIDALRSLLAGTAMVVVVSPDALRVNVPHPAVLEDSLETVEVGKESGLEALNGRLDQLGFVRKEFAESPGDYCIRGGLVDVYAFAAENPVRIEFFGDRIESIREFDSLSQRSIQELTATTIVPDLLSEHQQVQGSSSLLDFVHPDTLIILDEPEQTLRQPDPTIAAGAEGELDAGAVRSTFLSYPSIVFSVLADPNGWQVDVGASHQPAFNGSIRFLRERLDGLLEKMYRIHLTCDSQSELNRLKDLLENPISTGESGNGSEGSDPSEFAVDRISFVHHALHMGFEVPSARLAVYTEHQLFGRRKRRGKRKRSTGRGLSIHALRQLRRGELVVHADYGIGRFEGLQKVQVKGIDHEVLKISYEEGDTLYVNLNYINRVQKFSSTEGHVPKLSRLGSPEWQNLKSRAKRKIKDIARELIQLYSYRKNQPGFAFTVDTPWQKELEASFVFEDTFDQARSTLEVKRDMESPHPMDRLICGDVGFGKTEVAVRAAFKAVMNGKQVAALVPTTILALQHFNTFTDRLSRYPVSIAVISRFKTKTQQAEILARLAAGSVDIIIGTHRLLSDDAVFKDLGLLIIDEEHRFGVAAKERLRRKKANVDTITLTATPIPRTLHFSLMGARDLSMITTPPRNRLPILTEIVEYNEDLIRDAVLREINRGGQVYVVHDRVRDIDDVADRFSRIVQGARVRIAHGQMNVRELENVMVEFLERKFDVLVCTKIIESGLDIPNVNTILINRADRFGMAELHQLRGRVGRSNNQAYAFLITPPISSLTHEGLHRLEGMREFNELGAGFNLAMRDLEIRGAGNLLGSEQSGFIMGMGFETYTRILEEAVSELKEDEFPNLSAQESRPPIENTVVEVDVEALIPQHYIQSDGERLEVYRRLYQVSTEEQIIELEEELRDRFGRNPPELTALLIVLRLRLEASKHRFRKVRISDLTMELELPPRTDEAFYRSSRFEGFLSALARNREKDIRLKDTKQGLTVSLLLEEGSDVLARALSRLKSMTSHLTAATEVS